VLVLTGALWCEQLKMWRAQAVANRRRRNIVGANEICNTLGGYYWIKQISYNFFGIKVIYKVHKHRKI